MKAKILVIFFIVVLFYFTPKWIALAWERIRYNNGRQHVFGYSVEFNSV